MASKSMQPLFLLQAGVGGLQWFQSDYPFNDDDYHTGTPEEYDIEAAAHEDWYELFKAAKTSMTSFGEDYSQLRGKANEYEGLSKGVFLNRSAMKLVNLDHIFDLIWPSESSSTFSFVDLCGGPGGFIEYITLKARRRCFRVLGFGMSLTITDQVNPVHGVGDACNWNLSHLHDPPYSAFHEGDSLLATTASASGGIGGDLDSDDVLSAVSSVLSSCDCNVFTVKGSTGTGDIYSRANHDVLAHLVETCMTSNTTGIENIDPPIAGADRLDHHMSTRRAAPTGTSKYVDFVCSDGYDKSNTGFRMTLCQVLGMLRTLRAGGSFVMKIFSFHQIHCIKLFALLSQLFERVTIVKPITSRPASGERFLVAVGLRELSENTRNSLIDQLWAVADSLAQFAKASTEGDAVATADDENDISSSSTSTTMTSVLASFSRLNEGGTAVAIEQGRRRGGDGGGTDEGQHEPGTMKIEWPFHVPTELFDTAREYLTAVNDSHLLCRLIAYHGIMCAAQDIGLPVDETIFGALGGIIVPTCGYYHDTNREYGWTETRGSVSKKTKKLSKAKKRARARQRKRVLAAAAISNQEQEEEHHGEEEISTTSVEHENEATVDEDTISRADRVQPVENIIRSGGDIERTEATDDKESAAVISASTAHSSPSMVLVDDDDDDCDKEDYDHQDVDSFHDDNAYSYYKVRDISPRRKPVRVHEYYKLWNVYDLDVVY